VWRGNNVICEGSVTIIQQRGGKYNEKRREGQEPSKGISYTLRYAEKVVQYRINGSGEVKQEMRRYRVAL